MAFNIRLLEVLCERFVIQEMVSVKVQGEQMYMKSEVYQRLSDKNVKDPEIFKMNKTKVDEMVLGMCKKFYLRPSKKTRARLVEYCKEQLNQNTHYVIFQGELLAVMDSLQVRSRGLFSLLLNRK